MTESNDHQADIERFEQELRDLGWHPVDMLEPTTGTPFTRWHPPRNPPPPADSQPDGDGAADAPDTC